MKPPPQHAATGLQPRGSSIDASASHHCGAPACSSTHLSWSSFMQITIAARGSRGYAQASALVRDKYRHSFAAEVEPQPGCFALVRQAGDAHGAPAAVAGLSFAEAGRLFSERYLDAPVEALIGAREGGPVARAAVLEVGSLASKEMQAGTELMRSLPMLAWCLGRRYALCTATLQVRRLFGRLDMEFIALQAAGIDRLDEGARAGWGDYYSRQPLTGYTCVARMTRGFAAATGRYRFEDIVVNLAPAPAAARAITQQEPQLEAA
jgi:hypothetical protein